MATHGTAPTVTAARNTPDFDAIIVGGGFGGLRMLYELRKLGLSVKVIENGSDVGGTWYWNRYPGARTDSECWYYDCYTFAKEFGDEWNWSERFPSQAEVLAYLRFIAERFDLRKDIQFKTRVESAIYDEAANIWSVSTDQGNEFTCSYFITAVGAISQPHVPSFPGLDKFAGQWFVTGRWPATPVEFAGQRVAVIGTGATGVQAIPLIAHTAAQLTVFQRTPNYVLPARNYQISGDERHWLRANAEKLWDAAHNHFFGMAFDAAGRNAADVSPAEQQRVLDGGWETGGFRFIFETFDDIFTDDRSNALAAEYVRNKIRAIVKDPVTAAMLCPSDHPIGGKRPPLGHGYYETFNKDNVALVDVNRDPIVEITATGVRTANDDYAADMIVFATGFDAQTGGYVGMDIRGRDGVSIKDQWATGPRTHLGIGVDGFPNMFMVAGPETALSNIPPVIEVTCDWIGKAIGHLRDNNLRAIEPTALAADDWSAYMARLVAGTVVKNKSWWFGDNVPGKPHKVLYHFGGFQIYSEEIKGYAERGYEGFSLT